MSHSAKAMRRVYELFKELDESEREGVLRALSRHGVTLVEISPHEAYTLALGAPFHEGYRAIALQDPKYAFYYAKHVDKHAGIETRQAACGHPTWALRYALEVDKGYHIETERALLEDPYKAAVYGEKIRGSNCLREAACLSPESALLYAMAVDKRARPDTWEAVRHVPSLAETYRREVGLPMEHL